MKVTLTITMPDEGAPSAFRFVRAILDEIEPGAAGHTLGIYRASDRGPETYRHHRLGVDIEVAEAY